MDLRGFDSPDPLDAKAPLTGEGTASIHPTPFPHGPSLPSEVATSLHQPPGRCKTAAITLIPPSPQTPIMRLIDPPVAALIVKARSGRPMP